MAITLRHDAVGVGGNTGGGGGGDQKRKFGQALVLQQQQITQDNLQRTQDRMFDLGRMRLDRQAQFVRDNRMIQADRDMFDARQKAENERMAEQRKFQKEDMEAQNQQNWMQQNTRNLEGQVAQIRGMMSQQQYTPEGQQLYGELAGALRVIEGQRDTIRPQEYNKLLNQWLDNVERAGLDKFVAKPPTIEDELRTRKRDLGTGYTEYLQPNGDIKVLKTADPDKTASTKGAGDMSSVEYFDDDSRYEAARKMAINTLERRYQAKNPNAISIPEFDSEEVHAQMLKEFNDRQGFRQQLRGNQASTGPAAPQPVAPSPADVSDSVSPTLMPTPQLEGVAQPGAPTPIPMPQKDGELRPGEAIPTPRLEGIAQPGAGTAIPTPLLDANGNEIASVNNPYKELQDQDLQPSSPAGEAVPVSKGPVVPDFDTLEKASSDDASRNEIRNLRKFYDSTQDQETRDAISVIASNDASKESILRAVAMLKRKGVDIQKILNPPEPPTNAYIHYDPDLWTQ